MRSERQGVLICARDLELFEKPWTGKIGWLEAVQVGETGLLSLAMAVWSDEDCRLWTSDSVTESDCGTKSEQLGVLICADDLRLFVKP